MFILFSTALRLRGGSRASTNQSIICVQCNHHCHIYDIYHNVLQSSSLKIYRESFATHLFSAIAGKLTKFRYDNKSNQVPCHLHLSHAEIRDTCTIIIMLLGASKVLSSAGNGFLLGGIHISRGCHIHLQLDDQGLQQGNGENWRQN